MSVLCNSDSILLVLIIILLLYYIIILYYIIYYIILLYYYYYYIRINALSAWIRYLPQYFSTLPSVLLQFKFRCFIQYDYFLEDSDLCLSLRELHVLTAGLFFSFFARKLFLVFLFKAVKCSYCRIFFFFFRAAKLFLP